jgi:hypothetical protein
VSFALEASAWSPSSPFSARLVFRRNDPEVLSVFPYAYDAWNLYWSVGVSTDVGAARKTWKRRD